MLLGLATVGTHLKEPLVTASKKAESENGFPPPFTCDNLGDTMIATNSDANSDVQQEPTLASKICLEPSIMDGAFCFMIGSRF